MHGDHAHLTAKSDPGYQNWKISIIPWIPQALSIESSVCLACVLKRSVNYLMLLIALLCVICTVYTVYIAITIT